MTDMAGPNAAAIAWPKKVTAQRRKVGWLAWLALAISLALLSPIVAVAAAAFGPGSGTWAHLVSTVLPIYIGNTVLLVTAVTVGVFITGTGTAWLVTMCRFPGKRILEWALILPFAAPAYVIAYAYTDFLQHPGPVQTWLRAITGWGPRDYWFPEIRSLEGAAIIFTLVLYPYVYLLGSRSLPAAVGLYARGCPDARSEPVEGLLQGGPPNGTARHRRRDIAGADGNASRISEPLPTSEYKPSPPASIGPGSQWAIGSLPPSSR